ncbi:hypothetical protein [Chamaesiphon sp.]|uniref:hypothetical protein n=1 Tax=Chamaesiphon sp. TaxID=2814140 RepID=UPI00359492BC
MTVRKKSSSASDVLRQEMQQPLVIPERIVPASDRNNHPEPNPTTTNTNMNPPNDDTATIAQLKAAQEKESKLQQQQFEALTKELKDAKEMIVKLAEQGQAPAKGKTSAMVKKDTSRSNASITARPTESREETARRRANTDIGWLD